MRLVRPRDDRVFRGVCAAIGRATGTDPVLWRVVVVVLALFGGSGLVLYLAGWLLIPEEGEPQSIAERFLHRRDLGTPATVVLVVLAALLALAVVGDGRGLVPLAVIAVLGYLVVRSRREPAADAWGPAAPGAAWPPPPAWSDPATAPGHPTASPWPAAPPAMQPPGPPPPPRPRSSLGLLTVSAVALVVGGLLLAAALGVDGVTAPRVLAAALAVTGLGLLVGTRWGRSRGLLVLAAVLALAVGATSSFDGRYGSSAGDRVWVVEGSARHSLGLGSGTLDLRPLAGTERRNLVVEGSVGAGELVVLVPDDLRYELDARVGLGELRVPDDDGTGSQVENGADLEEEGSFGPPGRRTVRLDVEVGTGSLEVRRVPS